MKRITDTRIFIDGGDPEETAQAKRLLGYIDGQTTNPSLVAKNPEIKARMEQGDKLTREELLASYRKIVRGIAAFTPGPISIEVYADASTTSREMITQARDMTSWVPQAVVKRPTTVIGLEAATSLCREMRLNLTLCFSQEQAAAVYAATKNAVEPVFVSPFLGRLDDRGENGVDLVANILRLLAKGDGHVHVLAASIRSVDHILACLHLKVPALTLPFRVFSQWAERGFPLPDRNDVYRSALQPIPFKKTITLDAPAMSYDVRHPLTDAGLKKFADDWNALLK
jgi:transaldolase